MGCAESKSLEQELGASPGLTEAVSQTTTTVQKSEPEAMGPVKKVVESPQIIPKSNSPCEDSNLESSKKDKRVQRNNTVSKRPVAQRMKPKELSQVQPAWGKKTTMNEDTFLEDLRLLQEATGKSNNYEHNYHVEQGVDKKARLISGDENLLESSNSDIVDNQMKLTTEEESFDASKIIDVEKFRAANVGEKICNQVDNTHENVKSNLSTTESNEIHKLTSSIQEMTEENDDSLKVLYNDDDNDLIKSIEQEFAQDYYLPGQIIN